MTLDEYKKLVALEAQVDRMRQPFVEKAREIARQREGGEFGIEEVIFEEDRVVYTYYGTGMYSQSLYDGHFPIHLMFDPKTDA